MIGPVDPQSEAAAFLDVLSPDSVVVPQSSLSFYCPGDYTEACYRSARRKNLDNRLIRQGH